MTLVFSWFAGFSWLAWLGTDPALAVVSHEARWADVPPDWLTARAEYEDDR